MVERSLRNIINSASIIRDASIAAWGGASVASLWWDNVYRVLTPTQRNQTYDVILGAPWLRNMRVWFDRHRGREEYSSRWKGPFDVGVPLPPDALIIRAFSTKGTVVASRSAGTVVKFMPRRSPALEKLENEVSALRLATGQGLVDHIPELVSSGENGDGKWLITTLAPDTRPFLKRSEALCHLTWRRWLASHLHPLLADYYSAAGLVVSSAVERVDRLLERASADVTPRRIVQLLMDVRTQLIEDGDVVCVTARVHGDLVPDHVHRTDGAWKLIDWGESRYRDLSFEFFRRYWRSPLMQGERNSTFWSWLSGIMSFHDLHWIIRSEIRMACGFYAKYLNLPISSKELRLVILVSMLEEIVDTATSTELLDDYMLGRPDLWDEQGERLRVDLHRLRCLGV